MECRLCLSSSPAEDLVSIYDDPRLLKHLIWTCCRLRVRQEDELPDMVCLSCVNNLELLDGFRNACFRNDTTSRVEIDSYLKIKSEELLLDDLIWENESGADCPPNISSSAENGETYGGNITSNDNMAEIIDTNSDILAEELPLRKALDKMCSTDSELDHIHSGVKPHKCEICLKSFPTKRKFNRHMLIHSEIKPHKCEICLKSFRSIPCRNKHMLIHSEVKPHKCGTCLKSFHSIPYLNKHMLIHSEVKPHKCEICLKLYTSKSNFTRHLLIHSEVNRHKCEICFKSLPSKHNFTKHMLIHSEVKPHKCEICFKSFTSKYHFNRHLLIHSELNPHKCEICLKSFISKHYLHIHMSVHTGVK
ncbi:uncharacterized protein LOC143913032 [Arctopsyche grandis]|uniref:uncharacterized protein LOC143913032 n=1 Tax=Arctopsyche grandis TaxID=121162 RepID=UPI00406D6CE4